jgi:hypothetical protein
MLTLLVLLPRGCALLLLLLPPPHWCCCCAQLGPCLEHTITWAREKNLPLIIDGSGINFIAPRLSLIKGYRNCILTPNIAEFGRLAEGVGLQLEGKIGTHWQAQVRAMQLWSNYVEWHRWLCLNCGLYDPKRVGYPVFSARCPDSCRPSWAEVVLGLQL